jgi:hypothetical protein
MKAKGGRGERKIKIVRNRKRNNTRKRGGKRRKLRRATE